MTSEEAKAEVALKKIGRVIVEDAKATLKKLRKIATAKLYNTLWFKVDGYSLEFIIEPYGVFVDQGRKPNSKMPPKGSLLKWMRIKGIDSKYEFVIRRAIGKRGIKPTYFFTNALDLQQKNIDQIIDQYMNDLLEDVTFED